MAHAATAGPLGPAAPMPANSLLQLIWLASPALPVGGFSYSEVLEAAVKAVPLGQSAGQSAGQRILAQLSQEIVQAVAHALLVQDGERQAFAPMLAILSAQHETQYSRLFRS